MYKFKIIYQKGGAAVNKYESQSIDEKVNNITKIISENYSKYQELKNNENKETTDVKKKLEILKKNIKSLEEERLNIKNNFNENIEEKNIMLKKLKEEITNLNKTIEEKKTMLKKIEEEITKINETNNTSEFDEKLLKLKKEEEDLTSQLNKEEKDDQAVKAGEKLITELIGEKQNTKLIEGKKS